MKSFCIIGLGKFGTALALRLAEEGNQVMVLDTDAEKVNAIADMVTNAVIGDPSNENVLRSAGVTDYECAVVCFSGNVNDNVLITILLKELGVKKVVSRAANDGHKKVLEHIGADVVVYPEKDMGEKLAFMLTKENVTEFIEFSGYKLVELRVPDAWVGKSLIDLDVRRKYGINVIAVTRSTDDVADVSPSPSRQFSKDEKVSVIGSDKDIEKLMKTYQAAYLKKKSKRTAKK